MVVVHGRCVIRAAGPGDAVVLATLNAVVQRLHHEALPDEFKEPDQDGAAAFFAGQLVRREIAAFVADVDADAVGYAFAEELRRADNPFTFTRSALYVHHVAVVPGEQRRGAGRALMTAVDDEARRRGLDEVRLDYWSFNSRARRFFGSLGFQPFNERTRRALRDCTPPT